PEAKPYSANGTALDRMWESRTPPQPTNKKGGQPHYCGCPPNTRANKTGGQAARETLTQTASMTDPTGSTQANKRGTNTRQTREEANTRAYKQTVRTTNKHARE
ncbi:hypothetical protein, partial [Schaalia sp. lx-100]|uniref:hypothetical protein n=1 Tax=Schaalia sp. lx-100 TaxID=2899081 RepID=UPI001E2F1F9A